MLILGHRGYREKFIENTMKSIKKAIEYGAHGIECDIQKIGSNDFIVFHDSDLVRMANIDKQLSECNRENIELIRIKGEEKIPFLEELLTSFPKDKFLNIEIKKETININDCKIISGIIKEKFGTNNLLISSFEHSFLPVFKKDGFKVGMLFGKEYKNKNLFSIILKILKINPYYLNLPVDIFDSFGEKMSNFLLKIFKFLGKKIVFWTVNDVEILKKIIKYSDIIITDRVELILEEVKKYK